MKLRNAIFAGMLALAPLNVAKAQTTAHVVPEVGVFGNVKAMPTLLGGVNGALSTGKNYADVFIGGTLDKNANPGFAGIVFDKYSWNKNWGSWIRDLFLVSKGNATSTINAAPIVYSVSTEKFNVSAMPAYVMNHDFINNKTTHGIAAILQAMYSITQQDNVCLEVQYGTIPNKVFQKTCFGAFKDCFNFTATCQIRLWDSK